MNKQSYMTEDDPDDCLPYPDVNLDHTFTMQISFSELTRLVPTTTAVPVHTYMPGGGRITSFRIRYVTHTDVDPQQAEADATEAQELDKISSAREVQELRRAQKLHRRVRNPRIRYQRRFVNTRHTRTPRRPRMSPCTRRR